MYLGLKNDQGKKGSKSVGLFERPPRPISPPHSLPTYRPWRRIRVEDCDGVLCLPLLRLPPDSPPLHVVHHCEDDHQLRDEQHQQPHHHSRRVQTDLGRRRRRAGGRRARRGLPPPPLFGRRGGRRRRSELCRRRFDERHSRDCCLRREGPPGHGGGGGGGRPLLAPLTAGFRFFFLGRLALVELIDHDERRGHQKIASLVHRSESPRVPRKVRSAAAAAASERVVCGRRGPPPSAVGLDNLVAPAVVREAAVDGLAGRHAGGDVGTELHDVARGKLEGVEVGEEHLGVVDLLSQRAHDGRLRRAAIGVDQNDLRRVTPSRSHFTEARERAFRFQASYRASHVLTDWVLLTWIWGVPRAGGPLL